MIAHVVLFQPRADLSDRDRAGFLEAIAAAARGIESVKAFRVGRRILHGHPGYEQAMTQPLQYAAIVEFEDRDALLSYLQHPLHDTLARHFASSAERALAYDYELIDGRDATALL